MATRPYTQTVLRTPLPSDRGVTIISWTGLASGDDGDPVEMPEAADRTVEFGGTFDASTVVFEGKVAEAFHVLTDPQGNAISKTAATAEQVEEITRYMRPRVTAGGGATSINVHLIVRR